MEHRQHFYLSASRRRRTGIGLLLAIAGVALLLGLLVVPPATSGLAALQPAAPTYQAFLPLVGGPPLPRVLIAAAYLDSTRTGEPDEAVLLWNLGPGRQPLAGWRLESGSRQATFPLTTTLTLEPGERRWCAAKLQRFCPFLASCRPVSGHGTPILLCLTWTAP